MKIVKVTKGKSHTNPDPHDVWRQKMADLTREQLDAARSNWLHGKELSTEEMASILAMARSCLDLRARVTRDIDRATIDRLEAHIAREAQEPDPDAPSPAFERWRCRAHTAERVCSELRSQLAAVTAERDKLQGLLKADPSIVSLHMGEIMRGRYGDDTAGLELALRHPGAQIIAEALAKSLDDIGAKNYTESTFQHQGSGRTLIVTVQWAHGKTPHQMREQAEQGRDACKREVERVLEILRAYAAHTYLSHSGSCCRSPIPGACIVTEGSCVCHDEDKAVMRLFGMFDTPERARTTSAELAAKGDG